VIDLSIAEKRDLPSDTAAHCIPGTHLYDRGDLTTTPSRLREAWGEAAGRAGDMVTTVGTQPHSWATASH